MILLSEKVYRLSPMEGQIARQILEIIYFTNFCNLLTTSKQTKCSKGCVNLESDLHPTCINSVIGKTSMVEKICKSGAMVDLKLESIT